MANVWNFVIENWYWCASIILLPNIFWWITSIVGGGWENGWKYNEKFTIPWSEYSKYYIKLHGISLSSSCKGWIDNLRKIVVLINFISLYCIWGYVLVSISSLIFYSVKQIYTKITGTIRNIWNNL